MHYFVFNPGSLSVFVIEKKNSLTCFYTVAEYWYHMIGSNTFIRCISQGRGCRQAFSWRRCWFRRILKTTEVVWPPDLSYSGYLSATSDYKCRFSSGIRFIYRRNMHRKYSCYSFGRPEHSLWWSNPSNDTVVYGYFVVIWSLTTRTTPYPWERACSWSYPDSRMWQFKCSESDYRWFYLRPKHGHLHAIGWKAKIGTQAF